MTRNATGSVTGTVLLALLPWVRNHGTGGSHTVKYRDGVSASDALNGQIRSVVTAYLLPTDLLNRVTGVVEKME